MEAIQITAKSRALNDPVSVVHIPIELVGAYESKLYWTIVESGELSEEFFNVTSNTLEIAIFGSTELINREWSSGHDGEVRISSSWRVFEISSGDAGDEVNYDPGSVSYIKAATLRTSYSSSKAISSNLPRFSHSTAVSTSGLPDPTTAPSLPRRHSLLSALTPISTPTTPTLAPNIRPSPPPPPSVPQITVLASPLACVGFPKTLQSTTQETIHRFLTWPERVRASLIPLPCSSANNSSLSLSDGMARTRPFLSYTKTLEGSSLVSEVAILRGLFRNDPDLLSGGELLGDLDSESDLGGEIGLDAAISAEIEEDDSDFVDEGKGYTFDSDPSRPSFLWGNRFTPPPDDDFMMSQSYSLPPTPGAGGKDIRISWTTRSRSGTKTARSDGGGSRRSASPAKKQRVGEDHYSVTEMDSPGGRMTRDYADVAGDQEEREGSERNTSGRKACLQLDCRSLGLLYGAESCNQEKHSPVTRFSTLLESGNIKMLYSSTFHTANILVEARDIKRAKRLLEQCRSCA